MKNISLTIDGKSVSSPAGTTILEAAETVGIEIPRLCYEQGITISGNCRICVVEVEGSRTLVGSCHTPVAEGMVVKTCSERVLEARRATIELLLTGHTGSCVTDVEARECRLHNLASDLEAGPPRFHVKQPRFYGPEQSAYILRDMSRCILCRKCIRACTEIAGKNVYSMGYRGFGSKVVVDFDVPLNKEVCKDCGICIDYCPTSALMWPEGVKKRKREEGRGKRAPVSEDKGGQRDNLLKLLKATQRTEGFVSEKAMTAIAADLCLPLSEVYGVASFYSFLSTKPQGKHVIRICKSLPCYLKHGSMIIEATARAVGIKPGETTPDGKFSFELTNCIGACDQAPAMLVDDKVYGNLNPGKIADIPRAVLGRRPMAEKIILQHCDAIYPTDIAAFAARGGFQALAKARQMGPEMTIAEVKASNLRGRGGAGFPTGVKWELARKSEGSEKYLICNADEGEVGTFKDRYIIQHDPFSLVEGIAIAAYAIGASKAYIYLRQEYRWLLDGLKKAVEEARGKGFIDLDIEIREGAGAYVCGEESALMNSIEGRRGEVRFRPPFPPVSGLFGKPTVINNVETLMNVAPIIAKGASWFSLIGTPQSAGTKVFSVSGDVARPGVYELVLGGALSELLELAGATDVKMVQIGGATGGVVPASMVETPLSYETVLGSGAILVLNSARDVIDFVCRTVEFLNEESCGECTPCREGTEVMKEIYSRLAAGDGEPEDVDALEKLSRLMMQSSLCGLGQAAPVPVLDTLKYFRNDYENRIKQSVFLRTLR